MFPFFETIQIKEGKPQNLMFHQQRVESVFALYFPNRMPFRIENVLSNIPESCALVKCNIRYNSINFEVSYSEYQPQKHTKFKLVEVPSFSYNCKFSNRSFFEQQLHSFFDYEIIFTRNNQLTDTTYSNIIFKKNNAWFTPKNYLLNGTKRQYLLKNQKIKEAKINTQNLPEYSHFKLINAMLDIETSKEYSIENIVI